MTMKGKTNPNDWEGGHDPELTGSEDRPMTRREHFDKGKDEAWWGDDPFALIPGAHGEDDQPW